ncbi:hypothetical protein BT96DRAFT_317952 [Gymnopus androsaceus JB14]|uniref:Uncharacterized protein n=1 Tax=Gymnopus androsaceus JB14 TaxID=1447944 RepID=A0A6A4H0E7_9AGAR|nr:hypothetical protein BT96DRAFT_317952 [Gymnopus androsaceus JB14]
MTTKRNPSAKRFPTSNKKARESTGGEKEKKGVSYFSNASDFDITGGNFIATGGDYINNSGGYGDRGSPSSKYGGVQSTNKPMSSDSVNKPMSPDSELGDPADDQVSPSRNEAIVGKIAWMFEDLPETAQNNAGQLVESAIRKVASGRVPFKELSGADTQKLIDDRYGRGVYLTNDYDIWTGLVNQEINIWRNNFGAEGLKSAQQFIDAVIASDPETSPAQKTREYIKYALQELDDETERFVWKSAPDEGFGMQEMILRTFKRAHLDKVDVESTDDVPFAAILLSFVAVRCALEWRKSNFSLYTSEYATEFSSWAPGVINGKRVERFKYSVYREILKEEGPTWWEEFLQAAETVDRKRKPQKVAAKQPVPPGERELMLVD